MRPHEQHTLDLIAARIAASDPDLARELSTSRTGRSPRIDTWIRRVTLVAVWLTGIAFGATLLGFGLMRDTDMLIAVGAAITAAVLAAGLLITGCHRHHRLR